MIKKKYCNIDVVTMAKRRIINVFNSANKIEMSISGGKDSICLSDLVFKLCQSGEIDKNKLVIDFIDEEAIYPCVEKIVMNMRTQWLSIGVKFNWWCIQVKHFNCFNQLTNDESFICWDETKKDVWIRNKPKFAITNDELLNERKDRYQEFLPRKYEDYIIINGLRANESIQRLQSIAVTKTQRFIYPIYDWCDTDVWNYIRENNLDFPNAYIYMYQVGVPINKMRISQFFSIDTASSLVKMCEFYPNLFDKICKREPNAYMAMLYFDTELFRRSNKKKQRKKDNVNYKQKLMELMKESWRFETDSMKRLYKSVKRVVVLKGENFDNDQWKRLCEIIIGGDPKLRSLRAFYCNMNKNAERSNIDGK